MSEKKKYDAVVLFLFGGDVKSSFANRRLINRAITEAVFNQAPLIMPNKVPLSVFGSVNVECTRFGGETICAYARNVKEDMAREMWKNILVIAATPVLDRCIRDLQRIYPGTMVFHNSADLKKVIPYQQWFKRPGVNFLWIRATLRFLWEELLFFVPWPIYRWFALSTKAR